MHSYNISVFSKSKILIIPDWNPQAKTNILGAAKQLGGSLVETNWKASLFFSTSQTLTQLSPSKVNKKSPEGWAIILLINPGGDLKTVLYCLLCTLSNPIEPLRVPHKISRAS